MKKVSLLIFAGIAFMLLGYNVQAQKKSVQEGDWLINLGVGPGNIYGGYDVGFGLGLKASVERGMWEVGPGTITLGGELGWAWTSEDYYGYSWSINQFTIAPRAAFHCGWNVPGLDTYAGFPLGVRIQSWSYNYNSYWDDNYSYTDDSELDLYMGFFIGASYFFTPSFGVNVEAGYSAVPFQAGVVFKL